MRTPMLHMSADPLTGAKSSSSGAGNKSKKCTVTGLLPMSLGNVCHDQSEFSSQVC